MRRRPAPDMDDGTVEVTLYGALRARFGATSAFQPATRRIPVASDARIGDVLATLGIPVADVAHLFLNGQYSAGSRRIVGGDRLGVFGRDMALLYRQYFAKADDPA